MNPNTMEQNMDDYGYDAFDDADVILTEDSKEATEFKSMDPKDFMNPEICMYEYFKSGYDNNINNDASARHDGIEEVAPVINTDIKAEVEIKAKSSDSIEIKTEYKTQWFVKKAKTTESPMRLSIENAKQKNHKITVSREIEHNRVYGSYEDTKELCDVIKNYGNINMYELIRPEQPINIFFDIEYPEGSYSEEEVFNALIDLLDKLMKETFSESFDACDIHSSGSVGKGKLRNIEVTKVSRHIVISGNSAFTNMKELKIFMNFLKHRIDNPKDEEEEKMVKYLVYTLNNQVERVVDFNVYGNNQNMKLPNQSKLNSTRIQKPEHEKDGLSPHLCGNYDDKELIEFFDVKKIPTFEYNQSIKEKKPMVGTSKEKVVYCSLYQDFKPKRCIPENDPAVRDDAYIIDSIDNTDQPYSVWMGIACSIKNIYGDREKGFELFDKYSSRASIYNYDNTRELWNSLIPKDGGYNKGTLINLAIKCNPSFKKVRNTDYLKQIVACDHTFSQITYNSQYVKPYPYEKYECIIAKSPMGSGKSYQIGNMLNNMDISNKKVLVLSPRRLFASSITGDLNRYVKDHKFVCYSQVENKSQDLRNVKYLVCQMESLLYLKADYDIIIGDEIVSCLTQFSSVTTMKGKLNTISNKFISIWKNASFKLVCDAFIDVKTIKFIENLERRELPKETIMDKFMCVKKTPYEHVVFILNEVLPVQRVAVDVGHCSKTQPLFTKLIQSLTEGKKCVFVTASKMKGDDFLNEYAKRVTTPLKYKFYHSNSSELDNDLYNVNDKWYGLDLVIYTTKITVGVNFDRVYFDQLFVYSSCVSACPRDIFQATMRVRHLNDNIMYYGAFLDEYQMQLVTKGFNEYKDCSIEGVKRRIIERAQDEINFESMLKIKDNGELVIGPSEEPTYYEPKAIVRGSGSYEKWYEMSRWLFEVHSYNTCEKMSSYFCHEMFFNYYLSACNYSNKSYSTSDIILYELEPYEFYNYNSINYTSDEIKIIEEKQKKEAHNLTIEDINKLQKYKYDYNVEDFKEKDKAYDFYFNPENYAKDKYFNILVEKRYDSLSLNDKEKRDKIYKEMSEKKAQKLDIIHNLTRLLKVSSSTDKVQKVLDIDLKIHSKYILEKRDEWFQLFRVRDQKDKEGKAKPTDMLMTINTIRQLLKVWSGSTIKAASKTSRRVKGNKIAVMVYKIFPPEGVDIFNHINN